MQKIESIFFLLTSCVLFVDINIFEEALNGEASLFLNRKKY